MPSRLSTLSLHDALPIWSCSARAARPSRAGAARATSPCPRCPCASRACRARWTACASCSSRTCTSACWSTAASCATSCSAATRSEEHTSELQSLRHLVCPPGSRRFPYTTLFRSGRARRGRHGPRGLARLGRHHRARGARAPRAPAAHAGRPAHRAALGRAPRHAGRRPLPARRRAALQLDRKSTRLNSSHLGISYALPALDAFPTRRSSDLVVLGAGGTALTGWRGSGDITVPEVPVRLARLPRTLDGLRIVQLSDVHLGMLVDGRFLRDVVQRCN